MQWCRASDGIGKEGQGPWSSESRPGSLCTRVKTLSQERLAPNEILEDGPSPKVLHDTEGNEFGCSVAATLLRGRARIPINSVLVMNVTNTLGPAESKH